MVCFDPCLSVSFCQRVHLCTWRELLSMSCALVRYHSVSSVMEGLALRNLSSSGCSSNKKWQSSTGLGSTTPLKKRTHTVTSDKQRFQPPQAAVWFYLHSGTSHQSKSLCRLSSQGMKAKLPFLSTLERKEERKVRKLTNNSLLSLIKQGLWNQ